MCLAIPGRVASIDAGTRLASVDVMGVRREVSVDLLDDVPAVDDWVLIHVGFAMSLMSADEAHAQLALLRRLGNFDEAVDEVRGYGGHDCPPAAEGGS